MQEELHLSQVLTFADAFHLARLSVLAFFGFLLTLIGPRLTRISRGRTALAW